MSFPRKVLVGLVSGLALGLFLGEYVAPLKVVADGFVKLLQMTVLPYVTLSIVSSLGALDADEAKRLGLRAGAVLLVLWAVALGFAFLFPLAFPQVENARFFSTTMLERRAPFNFVDLYIPSNPFNSLANNVVPAVVLFSIILGVALIGVERKRVLLDVLAVATSVVSRATRFVVGLTPYGIFAIAAAAAGTLDVQQLERIQVYLFTYVVMALLLAAWVLPGLVSALTPIGQGEILASTRTALITAFMAGDLFIVLPSLIDASKELLARHHLVEAHERDLPDVIVPASFNFPHTGKLLSLSFILFAGWFADAALRVSEYPRLAFTGLLTFFGSLNAAVPFLLDQFRIPADTFQLFLATSVVNARFGALIAAVHTVTVALLGSAALAGALRFDAGRLLRFAVVTVLLTTACLVGLRLAFSTVFRQEFSGAEIVYGMKPLFAATPARLLDQAPAPEAGSQERGVLENVRSRGVLRVCVLSDRLPYSFVTPSGDLVGFDVEMAHRLADDIVVGLEFVPATFDRLPELLGIGSCDLAMSGTPVTPLRATAMRFSDPYLDETLGFVVRDDLRDQFSSWSSIRALGPMRVGAPNLPYYLNEIRRRAPDLQLEVLDTPTTEALLRFDAFMLPAERGSVITLLHPKFSAVVPDPDPIKVPLAYPLARRDEQWAAFVNMWIQLKRRDGTIEALYRHWVLGQNALARQPRWSVVRNVLHWVK